MAIDFSQFQSSAAPILPTGLAKPLRIVAHRRSGNHLLWENLHINYSLDEALGEDGDAFKYHRPYKDAPEGFTDKYTCILLVRDPRDTLVSNWFYWKSGGEHRLKLDEFLKGITFSKYLYGLNPEGLDKFNPEPWDKMDMYLTKEHIKDPVGNWLDYTDWLPVVEGAIRYEDVVNDQEKVVIDFGKKFGLKQTKSEIMTVQKDYGNMKVGYRPRKGVIGDWKNHFSQEDLDYLLDRAGDKMKRFNYTDVTL